MEKYKFVTEFELRSSPKVLYPYLSTASGLERWLAEKVVILPNNRFDIQWDGESHIAEIVSMRTNRSVKYHFGGPDSAEDSNYLEFKLDVSELTQSTFLKVVDYSTNTDKEELNSLWDGFIERLKEIVGS